LPMPYLFTLSSVEFLGLTSALLRDNKNQRRFSVKIQEFKGMAGFF